MQKLEESSSEAETVLYLLYCEHVIPIFVHGKMGKQESHLFSSILNAGSRAV